MALTSYDDARARLIDDAVARLVPLEKIPLASACGRTLALDLHAPFAVPGFANAAMDGYAVAAGPENVLPRQEFQCLDLVLAGQMAEGSQRIRQQALSIGSCVEVATGALLPEGADTVIPYEMARREGTRVSAMAAITHGAHVRGAQDDYARNVLALRAGRILDAGALGVLAAFGQTMVAVRQRPRIAIMVTGSELVPAGTPLRPGQIHDSNSAMLQALLAPFAESLTLYGPVVDEIDVLRQTLRTAAASHDVVITAGGASAGRADFVPALVRELGEIRLWKVATRPGMPFLHGRFGEATIYGLPGNPVSVFASMLTLVIPALQAMLAMTPHVPERAMLLAATAKSHARVEWRRGQLTTTIDARRVILPHPMLGSGMLRGVAESNALFRLDAETRALGAGALVEVIPFPA